VRLPGARRFAAQTAAKKGIEIPDDLVAQIEKLCST
jgi:LDH2 family malate/lactate/ureidoglycolate dehydrogenase